ncbi:MAG TPA: bacterioferritin [Candidatus Polarisedimenticolia bacterium]|nr:bacterioferritin [Candidatus Polarisedimenticolia bacterium]
MKGDPKVLTLLNQVLRKELTGINQYFLHARMCANWGYHVLAKRLRTESIDEMKHADLVMERLLFLDGTPNMAEIDRLFIGKNVRDQLKSDLGLEMAAIEVLRPGIDLCVKVSDHATRELLEHILEEEEHHVDWLEAQLHQIEEMGYENYLTTLVGGEEVKAG